LDAADCPCAHLAEKHIIGKLTDADAIQQLAECSDVLTYEIEHVNVEALLQLEQLGKTIIPSPRILQVIQDKGLQKQFYVENNIPTAPFVLVSTANEWAAAVKQLGGDKIAAKTRKDGYDGKGVCLVNTADVLQGNIPFDVPTVLEQFIPCQKELSVMVARGHDGEIKTWPVVEMVFDPVANLVTFLECPSGVSESIQKHAREVALHAIEKLNGVGVFAVELFLTYDNQILVNEIAPRPHNSGHHTIEACYTSQFEQLVRILCNLPLGSTELIQPAVMMNLLGAPDFSGPYALQGLHEAMHTEGVYIHLYDKAESKPMRKMGHVTVTAPTLESAIDKAHRIHDLLRFVIANE
jgi:5-(carboxyamino)imidazole ribonucleotide synthase